MESSKLLDAHVQVKRMYNLLTEVLDLSRPLLQAVDRNDEVTVRMLLAMRGEPVHKLQLARQALEQQKRDLGEADGLRLAQLLNGEPPRSEEEKPLAQQAAANSRLLAQVLELDQRLNLKLTRGKSFYQDAPG